MSKVNRYFDEEIKAIAVNSSAIARAAAEELYDDVQRQIRSKFKNPSTAFTKGVKLTHYDNVSYVRLSPILSSYAESTEISGQPNLWILLPDGLRLGFKRIGKGFNWNDLSRRYGTNISIVAVSDGHVVLYRHRGGVSPIYKIQKAVRTKQRIEFYEQAEKIAEELK